MNEGYIKLYKSLISSDLWLKEPFTKGQAWVDLIALTNYKPGHIQTKNGEIHKVNRGECAWSMKKLATRWQWSEGKVKRFFCFLDDENMIAQKNIPNLTIIKVLNYSKYQERRANRCINSAQTDAQTAPIDKGKEERDSKLSLSHEEREILKNFLSRKKGKGKIENIEAYLDTIIKNSSYLPILEQEKTRLAKKQQEEIIPPPQKEEKEPEEQTEQGFQQFKNSRKTFLRLAYNRGENSA